MTEAVVREYRIEDAESIASIYYHTIHRVNCRDYTPQQIDAWAPAQSLDTDRWRKKHRKQPPLVAAINEKVVGFVELEADGHIDCFYCHHAHQRQGVGSALMQAAIDRAISQGITRLYAEVSTTAKPFFTGWGFKTIRENTVQIRGTELNNTIMERMLP